MSRFSVTDAKLLDWPCYMDCPIGDTDTVYIVGMYDAPFYDWTLENTKRAKSRIIKWCGSDAMALTRPDLLPEATHICDSEFIRRRLLTQGIDAQVIQAATPLHPEMTPLPDTPMVSVYFGGNPENYGASYVRFLQDALPDVRFHVYRYGQYDDDGMLALIDATTVALRLTSHDGSAAGTREFLEAGRYVVTTQEMPHAKQVSLADPNGVIAAIRKALKSTAPNVAAHEFYREHNSAERWLREFQGVLDERA